ARGGPGVLAGRAQPQAEHGAVEHEPGGGAEHDGQQGHRRDVAKAGDVDLGQLLDLGRLGALAVGDDRQEPGDPDGQDVDGHPGDDVVAPKGRVAMAWTAAAATPAAMASSSPTSGPHLNAPQAPNQVPKIIMPSMPMLTMPERSLNTPPRVARYRGTNARMAEAMVATPNSCTRMSGTVVLLPELAAGGHASHHLVGDHD